MLVLTNGISKHTEGGTKDELTPIDVLIEVRSFYAHIYRSNKTDATRRRLVAHLGGEGEVASD